MTMQQTGLILPTCDFCGNQWLPQEAVVASLSYCSGCQKKRRTTAARLLNAKPIGIAEGLGPYILPRREQGY